MPTGSQVAQPLGGATVSGTTITVDTYVNPPTKIPTILRQLVASNVGYFAETILSTPGTRVEGGAVIYEYLSPTDLFLPSDQGTAPRAPGAEAPRVGALRGEPKVARPESIAASVEVTDEARQRNNVIMIQNQFNRLANSIANTIQTTVIEALKTFVETEVATDTPKKRQIESPRKWTEETKQSELIAKKGPLGDIALVQRTFMEDKAGVLADTMIIHPEDWESMLNYYAGQAGILTFADIESRLGSYGIRNVIPSVLAPKGAPYFLKAGALGSLLYEQPLNTEQERIATRKTDVYVTEVRPVVVIYDRSAVLQLTKINE